MDKFMKSLLIGVAASIVLIGGIAGVGIWVSSEPSASSVAAAPKDDKAHTVRMRPQAVQVGGYSLKSKDKAKILLVSIGMRVTGGHNFAKVCRLMPRLVSSVNTAFANLASYSDNAQDAITKDLTAQLRLRFNKALGERVVDDVILTAYQDKKDVPATNCPEET
ncbi:MAG: hypothetical protein COW30_05515 [Rhodospirillales bacterium CG15_BIG_FIL_POST_REV_8_21_14_020_66_15]|nr:MAG: hypothetical protein COW30_05515 [Rhodospirillales bacterium CG15_BIG_FIL_POST_REV_8_21_14_020_66_15]